MRTDDPRDLIALNELVDLAQVEQEAERLIRRAGFSSFVYAFTNPGDWQEAGWSALMSGYDAAWLQRYFSADYNRLDPIPAYCFSTPRIRPLVWRPEIYDTPERKAFAEDALGHRIGAGITFPIFTEGNRRGAFCFSLDDVSEDAHDFVEQNQAWSNLLATYVHDAYQRLSPNPETVGAQTLLTPPHLTPGELRCLQWCAAGKTIWEIARVMAISESRIKQLRKQLCKKFDVPTLHQVVARAVAWKVIRP